MVKVNESSTECTEKSEHFEKWEQRRNELFKLSFIPMILVFACIFFLKAYNYALYSSCAVIGITYFVMLYDWLMEKMDKLRIDSCFVLFFVAVCMIISL